MTAIALASDATDIFDADSGPPLAWAMLWFDKRSPFAP
jgi:hypothetical protein